MTIKAMAAHKKSGLLKPFSFEPAPLGPLEVRVKVSHCGICRSDIHLIDNDWGVSHFPLVPGHEVIGTVIEVGPQVENLSKGTRVGIGWQRGACFQCKECRNGEENLCSGSSGTCVQGYGGFAEEIQIDSRFAFEVPKELTSEKAAPLFCGGITVYSPLKNFRVGPSMRVGIIGVGGLGHLAIQFASRMGATVYAFSSSPDKEVESKALGADVFVRTDRKSEMANLRNSMDLLLATAPIDLNWEEYFDLLGTHGTLCFVGAPAKPLTIPIYKLIHGRRSICGSPIGSQVDIRDMLAFSARHGVGAQVETTDLQTVNDAIQKVRDNKARYRMVLKISDR